MRIVDFLRPEDVLPDLAGETEEEVLSELARPLSRHGLDAQEVREILLRREHLGSTGIGDGVAVPHGMLPLGFAAEPPGLYASFGRSKTGIDFKALDGKPTRFFFALLVAESGSGLHLQALASVSRIFRNAAFREAILDAKDAAEIYRRIAEADAADRA